MHAHERHGVEPPARGGRTGPGRRPWALAQAVLLGALAGACTTPRGPQDGSSQTLAGAQGTPRWVGEPHSWAKLEEIERWLLESGRVVDPYWRLEGELELAEGRLFFARADQAQGQAGAQRVEARLAAAQEGFRRVALDPFANESQRRRALRRLDEGPLPEHEPVPAEAGGVVGRSSWGARSPLAGRLDPVGGPWRRITVHHSDEVPGVDLDGSLAHSRTALQKIQRFHQEQNGWADIGYHYLIDPEGRVFEGRATTWQGAHAGGTNNVQNLGICMLGNFHRDLPTPLAMASLERLLDETRQAHAIPRREVHLHRDYKDTQCPGDRLSSWVRSYAGTERSAPRASAAGSARAAARPASGSRSSSGVH